MQLKNRILVLIIAVLLILNDISAQNAQSGEVTGCPIETIQVHLSHQSIFTGDILYFKIYCSSPLFPRDEISSMAFIELVSSENNSVIRKKILLKQGAGSGEFEIPVSLSTGLYHILAYTNWMKNFGEAAFFSTGLIIINPELSFNSSFNNPDTGLKTVRTLSNNITSDSGNIIITADKHIYSNREKVTMTIEASGKKGKNISDFSVSVYRKEPSMVFGVPNSKAQLLIKNPGKILYLPDYKGIRLSGKISDQSGNTLSNTSVIMSLPGPGTGIRRCITDENGNFNFLLRPKEGEQDIVLTLPEADTKLNVEESYWNGFRDPRHDLSFELDQEAFTYLKEKFSHFQLQHRFKEQYFIKNRPEINPSDSSVFYSNPYQFIHIKNYITLDSLREYFHELAPSVKFTGRGRDFNIALIDPLTIKYLEGKAGVFLDGVLYDDYAAIANIPAREIDRIAILPCIYYYKTFVFGGIVDLHTTNSDFNGVNLLPEMIRFIYPVGNASEWKFQAPDYSISDKNGRVPDFRYLLYWEPNVKSDLTGAATVQFYTGDVKGSFVIEVVGISNSGEILHAESEISVGE
jgi:hypothetical protein